jgi:hypothetical protein
MGMKPHSEVENFKNFESWKKISWPENMHTSTNKFWHLKIPKMDAPVSP